LEALQRYELTACLLDDIIMCMCVCIELRFTGTAVAPSAAFPLLDPDVPRLTHLSKARPRNPKQHAAKRSAVVSECLLIEDAAGRDDGLDSFFSSGKPQTGSLKQKKPIASPRRYFCVMHGTGMGEPV